MKKIKYNGGDLKMFIKCPAPIGTSAEDYRIPEGVYFKVDHILQAIVESLPDRAKNKISFKHNRDGKLTIICEDDVWIEFPKQNPGLGSLLGFSDEQTQLKGISTGKYTFDLQGGVQGHNYPTRCGRHLFSIVKSDPCGK